MKADVLPNDITKTQTTQITALITKRNKQTKCRDKIN